MSEGGRETEYTVERSSRRHTSPEEAVIMGRSLCTEH